MERIGRRQAVLIGATFIMAPALVIIPSHMILAAGQDAWIGFLPPLAAGALSLWALSAVMSRFDPEQDLATSLVSRHPYVGRAVLLAYLLYFQLVFIRDLRMLADVINVILLPQTPIPMIAFMIALTAFLVARSGLEVIGRMTELFGLVLLIIVLSLPLLVLKDIHLKYLQPPLEHGIGPPLRAGWYYLTYVSEIAALPLMISRRSFRLQEGLKALLIGILLSAVATTTTVLVIGPYLSGRFIYPVYALVRHIRITDFLDRFDLLLVGLWMPAMLLNTASVLFVVCHLLARFWPVMTLKRTAGPAALLGLAGALFLFASNLELYNVLFDWPPLALTLGTGLPVLLALTVWPRRGAPGVSGGGSGSSAGRGAAGG